MRSLSTMSNRTAWEDIMDTGRRGWIIAALFMLLAFELTACHTSSNEAPNGTVVGSVRSISTGAPIAGAVISDGTSTATSDSTGAYTLSKKSGTYTLNVSAAGYAGSTRSCTIADGAATTMNWKLTDSPGEYTDYSDPGNTTAQIPASSMDYVILAWNDLGMHCAQDDYSYFLILPPFNTLHVQVMKRGEGIVTNGISVKYEFPTKTNSTAHTNFWTYAPKYGWNNLAPNVGITGTPLNGTMTLDENGLGYVATGIPITPYDDEGTWNPYGQAVITVVDSATGTVLQTANVVAPISTELNCSNCHGIENPFLNILMMHDKNSGTTLAADQAAGILHLCAECHGDNALGLAGKPGVENLSQAMHNFHKDKVIASADSGAAACYNCHPGPKTQCLRGEMYHAGIVCQDCHGDMKGMAAGLQAGRKPWLEEPRCGNCHGPSYSENPNTLYRNSVFLNSPDVMNNPSKMNGKLYCEACHNSTHAEFRSTNLADSSIPLKFQGDNYWIWNCYVCHNDYMPSPSMHM
jgi:Carboxypeptidase regulatory-like domain